MTNPYEAPQLVAAWDAHQRAQAARPQVLRAFARWTLVCVISAMPSFFWGCSLYGTALQIEAMLAGIATFVLLYTAAELSSWGQSLLARPRVRRTLKIGYGTRLMISMLFPLGMSLDLFTGLVSVQLVEWAWQGSMSSSDAPATFLPVYVTTLVQGSLLNATLLVYMLVIHAAQWTFSGRQDELQPTTPI